MEAFAHVKFVRMSPRKVKLVCDMIRGKDVKTAAAYLSQTSKAACEPMAKLLKSAVANAEHNNGMNADNLYVSTVIANPGPVLKRGRIASRRGFVRIIKDVTQLADTMRRAFQIAKSGRPGPVLVDITKNVTATETEYEPMAPAEIARVSDTICECALKEAADLINAAKKPMISSWKK